LCWGSNVSTQLGDGTNVSRFTPTPVVGLSAGTASIQAGDTSTCALTTSGAVKCWGGNSAPLGNGTQGGRSTPTDVVGLSSGVTDLSVGGGHACAVTSMGGVRCWGNNANGKLGDGTKVNRLSPVDVIGLASSIVKVSVGGSHTCALSSTGAVQCWGNNQNGQLGIGSLVESATPRNVVGLTGGVTKVVSSVAHSCALTNTGAVFCWGANSYGLLGDGTKTTRTTAVQVAKLDGRALDIEAGGTYNCAATTSGAMCWGRNFRGYLGNGTTTDSMYPTKVSSD
jgi:alpha-tubulin suppressor-like RCC1 family protein